MKRFLCIALCVVLVLALNSAFASDQARVYINDISASAGDTVTVRVMAERVSACSGGSLNVVYDPESLELISCEKGEAMEGVSPFISSTYDVDTLRMTWMTSGTIRDGSLCDIVFQVKDSALRSLSVKLEELKLSDVDGNPISASVTDGWIVLGAGSVNVTGMSLLDYNNAQIETLIPGSNKVRTELHNTMSVPVEPFVVYTLYKNNELYSTDVRSAGKTVGRNETVTIEQAVNVPMAKNVSLTVTVWDGVLNVEPIQRASFAGR